MTKKLYAYIVQFDKNDDTKIKTKFGDTTRTVEHRMNEECNGISMYPTKVCEIEVPDYVSDKKHLFPILELAGWENVKNKNDNKSEVYLDKNQNIMSKDELIKSIVDVMKLVKQNIHNGDEINIQRVEKVLREEQLACLKKGESYFKNTSDIDPEFAIVGKCRYGKTIVALRLAQQLGCDKIFVGTYFPSTKDGWRKETLTDTLMTGYGFYTKETGFVGIPASKFVYFGTFQDLLGKVDGKTKSHNKWVLNTVWDMVILDEFHYGMSSENAQSLLSDSELSEINSKIQTKKKIYSSATPIKWINSGRFSDDQIFKWDYDQEFQMKQKYPNDPRYTCLPVWNIYGIDVSERISEYIKEQGDFKFSLEKMLEVDDDGFVNERHVSGMLKSLRGARDSDTKNIMNGRYDGVNGMPYFDKSVVDNIKHSMWYFSSVAQCNYMEKLLRKDSYYSQYEIINASGDNIGSGDKALQEVKNKIKNTDKNGSITLTCGKLTTGVTIEEWSAVFVFSATKSVELYIQMLFRASSVWTELQIIDGEVKNVILKENFYVFDMNPSRALSLTSEYSRCMNPNDSERDICDNVIQSTNIFIDGNNGMRRIENGNELYNHFIRNDASTVQRRISSGINFNINITSFRNILTNQMVVKAFKSFPKSSKLTNNNIKKINELNIIENNNAPQKANSGLSSKSQKAQKLYIEKINEILKTLCKRVLFYNFINNNTFMTIQDIINNYNVDAEDIFDMDVNTFTFLITSNVVKIRELERTLTLFNISDDENKISMLSGAFENMIFTPPKIALDMVNDVYDINKNNIYVSGYDKSGVVSNIFLTKLFLDNRMKISDEKERTDYIINENLRIIPFSDVSKKIVISVLKSNKYCGKFIDNNLINGIMLKYNPTRNEVINPMKLVDKNNNIEEICSVGNPPYQKNSVGRAKAAPIFHTVYNIMKSFSDKVNFITPSRWMTVNGILQRFRIDMTKNNDIAKIVDYSDSKEVFDGVDIKGGVSSTLWIKGYNDMCNYTYDGVTADRFLKSGKTDMIIRNNRCPEMVDKVTKLNEETYSSMIAPTFQYKLRTNWLSKNEDKWKREPFENSVKVYGRYEYKRIVVYIDRSLVTGCVDQIDKWKVYAPNVSGSGDNNDTKVIGTPIVGEPNSVCTETFKTFGIFDSELEAVNCIGYVKSKFFRYFTSLLKNTPPVSSEVFQLVPLQDFTEKWTDEKLYKKYDLVQKEIDIIESTIESME